MLTNKSKNNFQNKRFISPMPNNYRINNEDDESLNMNLNQSNRKKSNMQSYRDLINSYSVERKKYNNLYENKSRAIPTLNLQHLYLKNQENYDRFMKNKAYKKGLKLEGNKEFEGIPVEQYLNEIETYRENINELIKHNDWYYSYPDENTNNENKMKLTPLPSKSRLLMNTNKEKKDFNFAERNAVMMRRVEYTHSLITDSDKIEKKRKLDREREKIYLIMKSAVLTIEDWWIDRLKKKKEREEQLKKIIENNRDTLNNFFNNLENIYYMKNKNDEKRNLMIEFFRRLLKIKEKYEKKKKLVNNNLKIQNLDRDNDEPEILRP